jgi:hypothetical protein
MRFLCLIAFLLSWQVRPSLGMLTGWIKGALNTRQPQNAPQGPVPPPEAYDKVPREVPLPYGLQVRA